MIILHFAETDFNQAEVTDIYIYSFNYWLAFTTWTVYCKNNFLYVEGNKKKLMIKI